MLTGTNIADLKYYTASPYLTSWFFATVGKLCAMKPILLQAGCINNTSSYGISSVLRGNDSERNDAIRGPAAYYTVSLSIINQMTFLQLSQSKAISACGFPREGVGEWVGMPLLLLFPF